MVATNASSHALPGAPSSVEAIQHPCTPGLAVSSKRSMNPTPGNAPGGRPGAGGCGGQLAGGCHWSGRN